MDWLLLLLRTVLGLLRPNGTEPQPVAVRPDGTTVPLPPGSLSAGMLSAEKLAETLPAGPARCIGRSLGDWLTLFLPFDPRVPRGTFLPSRLTCVGSRYLRARLAAHGLRCLILSLPPRVAARDGFDARVGAAVQRIWSRMTHSVTLRNAPVTQGSMSQGSESMDDGREAAF